MLHRITRVPLALVVVCGLGLLGCKPAMPPVANNPAAGKAEHDHPDEGPHHGHLIELGTTGEYHAELTHDDATKTVTIYLLGKDAKTPVAITDMEVILNLVVAGEPLQTKLPAARQESDPEGKSSRFSIVDEKLLEALEAEKTTGKLNVNIDGAPYSGPVEHLGHGHDHK